MKNKETWFGMLFMVLALGVVFVGCASAPVGADLTPSNSQAVVSVTRQHSAYGSLAKWVILIDGVEAGKVANNGKTNVLVDNGSHTIQLDWMGVKTSILEFTADSNEILFWAGVNFKNGSSAPELSRSPIDQVRQYNIQ